MISAQDQSALLTLARRSLEARVRREPEPSLECLASLNLVAGAFVTIHRSGELRGCLGRIESDWPLSQVVAHLAAVVADSDPRFDPVEALELADIDIEISVLLPEREIHSIDDIEVGRHGLIVEQGSRRGLLLPQVPTEHGWDRKTFVEHTCLKAGLSPVAWQRGAQMFVFEAEVFGEKKPAG
jgi:AmmeMemoRadiSam system protein A